MTPSEYFLQQAVYNLTIQSTVASTLGGVTPQDVTEISVSAAAAPAPRRLRAAATSQACLLSYKVNVKDPTLTFRSLKSQMDEAVITSKMDEHLHHYAAVFGATKLGNASFGDTQVQRTSEGRADSAQLTGAETAGVVIGVLFAIALIVVAAMFAWENAK